MVISIIHPSRSRVERSFNTIKKWIDRSVGEIEIIVSLDENDPDLPQYVHKYSMLRDTRLIVNANLSAIDAINKAAKESTGDILIVVSDDTDCCNRWDEVIKNAVGDSQDYLLRVNDGIQKYICTMPIMDRIYYNRFGYIYHPSYRHMFCDTFLTHVADVTKRIIWRDDILFQHLHYSIKKSEKDSISERADETVHSGKMIYLDMVRKNFNGIVQQPFDIWDFDLRAHISGHVQWLKNYLSI